MGEMVGLTKPSLSFRLPQAILSKDASPWVLVQVVVELLQLPRWGLGFKCSGFGIRVNGEGLRIRVQKV